MNKQDDPAVERVLRLFYQKLLAQEPNHPWRKFAPPDMQEEPKPMNDLFADIGATLEHYAEQERDNAAQMGCSAGNFDGGSAWSCEHCQALENAKRLEEMAGRLIAFMNSQGFAGDPTDYISAEACRANNI